MKATTDTAPQFEKTVFETLTSYKATIRKNPVTVIFAENFITVYVENSAHRAWRGPGKTFFTHRDLLNGYRSAPMVAFLTAIVADRDAETANVTPIA